ncbi:MAG: pyridoxal phosphate-dependent aminotransferase [Deltaproteobacteria bacterium]|nr:pyridoxal phosphate-dependent aminotransferase [Deltaproteobacteria bacterium]MBW2413782.1 pyridoxal phosphate-dependent aminotransferase [Deltaproteobacteria bacterium]
MSRPETRGLSRRAAAIQPSPIRTMTVECARVGGVNLAQGVCDTPAPPQVRDAAVQAIQAGENAYSRYDGRDELRRALAGKMRRDNGLEYDPETEVIVTVGATGAFYIAALGLLEAGDEVVLFEPYYGYHVNTLVSLDVTPVYVPLEPPDWSVSMERLEAAITPRTRAVVLNTPANPSGKVFTLQETEQIARVVRDHDLFLFTDEVYEHFVFDGREHVSPAALPGMRERTLTMNALSKTFSITGWRLGWLAADRRWASELGPLNDLVYVCPPTPLQLGAARALEELPPAYYANIGPEYQRKRDQLCTALDKAGLPAWLPEGSYFALADISRLPGDTGEARALHLLADAGIAVVPGEAFFAGDEGHAIARFCFGKTQEDLDEACRRLERLG